MSGSEWSGRRVHLFDSMILRDKKLINRMEWEIIRDAKKIFGKNLISLFVEGSYGNHDFIKGYSDYDLLTFVKDINKVYEFDFNDLSEKYSIDIQCVVRSYEELVNRIKNNSKATRFIGNLELIKIKKQTRLLAGKDIKKLIPDVKKIRKRDLGSELRASYFHATNLNPGWNIYKREPRKWVNYIINMSNALLLSKGIIVRKSEIPPMLKKHLSDFGGTIYVKKALNLRKTKKVLKLNRAEKNKLKSDLTLFLEEYKKYLFRNPNDDIAKVVRA